jgi:3-methyladenine DNA glycosylase AlkC
MYAHYALTQRFTSEFAIRPFIQRYPEKCFALLTQWAKDSNLHVRRLVSEGTRLVCHGPLVYLSLFKIRHPLSDY